MELIKKSKDDRSRVKHINGAHRHEGDYVCMVSPKLPAAQDFKCSTVAAINPLTSRPGCMPGSRYTGIGVLFFVI